MRERSVSVLKLSRNRQIPNWDIACWWLEMLSFDDEQVIPVWRNVWTASSLRILGQVDLTVTFVKLNISWSFPYVLFLQWGVHMLVYMCSSSLSYIHYFCNEERTCPLCSLMRERSYFVLKLSRNRRVHQYWSVWNQTFKASNNSSLITLIGHETMVCTVSMA